MKVVVVGCGVAGAAVALELAARGAEVTVLDRDQPGTGATGASAGMLCPQYETPEAGPAFQFAVESRALWPGFARRVETLAGWSLGLRMEGMLVANRTPHEEAQARRMLEWQLEAGLRGEILSPAEARRIHPYLHPIVHSWCWLPQEGQVDAQRLAVALADAVRGSGARLRAARAAVSVWSEGERVRGVRLADGTVLEASSVVLAAGAWAPLIRDLPVSLPVRPVRGQILRLRPRSPSPWPLVADHHGCYLVPRENGTLLVGSTMEEVGYDQGVTDEARARLAEGAASLLPPLEQAIVVERWAGLRPMTPDTLPLLGPDPLLDGLHYATGYGRNGILFAPLAARVVADLILTGSTAIPWEAFSSARFPQGSGQPFTPPLGRDHHPAGDR